MTDFDHYLEPPLYVVMPDVVPDTSNVPLAVSTDVPPTPVAPPRSINVPAPLVATAVLMIDALVNILHTLSDNQQLYFQ